MFLERSPAPTPTPGPYVGHRPFMIIIGALLIVGSVAAALVSWLNFEFRRTYFRRIGIAEKAGANPYDAAVKSAEALARDFIEVVLIYAAFVVLLAVLLIGLSFLRSETPRE